MMVGEMVRWISKGGEEGGKGLVGQFERWVRCAAANGFGFGFEMGWDGMGWTRVQRIEVRWNGNAGCRSFNLY